MAQYMLPIEDDERAMLASVACGDETFDLLYRNFAPALRSFCASRLADPADAASQGNWPLPAAIPLAALGRVVRAGRSIRRRAAVAARVVPIDATSLAIVNGVACLAITAAVVSMPSTSKPVTIDLLHAPAVS